MFDIDKRLDSAKVFLPPHQSAYLLATGSAFHGLYLTG